MTRQTKFTQIFFSILTLLIVSSSLVIITNAQSTSIIDWRCKREQTLKPYVEDSSLDACCGETGNPDLPQCQGKECPNLYARDCCVEANTEEEVECMEKLYPARGEDTGLFGKGGLNFFGTDVIINRETLPAIVRLAITIPAALFVVFKMIVLLEIAIRYAFAIYSKNETKEIRQEILNGIPGVIFGAGAIIIVTILFRLIGYRGDVFDFSQDADRLLTVDCEGIESQYECEQYNLSCYYADTPPSGLPSYCLSDPEACGFKAGCQKKEEQEPIPSDSACEAKVVDRVCQNGQP